MASGGETLEQPEEVHILQDVQEQEAGRRRAWAKAGTLVVGTVVRSIADAKW